MHMHSCMHTHIQTQTNANTHTCTHVHTNIHIHLAKLPQCISFCSHIVDTLPAIPDYLPYTPNLSILSCFLEILLL